jgi:hypothetical protein
MRIKLIDFIATIEKCTVICFERRDAVNILYFSEISYYYFNLLKISLTVMFTSMHPVLYWFTAFLLTLSCATWQLCRHSLVLVFGER